MIDSFKGQLCKNVEIIIQIYGLSCSVNNTLIDKELVTLVLAVYFYIDQKKNQKCYSKYHFSFGIDCPL